MNQISKQNIIVLGVSQDAGLPQANCSKKCCTNTWNDISKQVFTSSLGIIDKSTKQHWIIDATTDFKHQLNILNQNTHSKSVLSGIIITHGHMGHYTGLMHLGKEAMNTKNLPVFVAPKMKELILNNHPWKQLVRNQNIDLITINSNHSFRLSRNIVITPLLVPHRNELTETLGFTINGKNKSVLFIPDADNWSLNIPLTTLLKISNQVLIDGTFFNSKELPERNLSEIPHPTISQTMKLLKCQPKDIKNKVFFIHLNHSNPALNPKSPQTKIILKKGFNLAKQNMIISL